MIDPLFANQARQRVVVALPLPIDSLFDYAVPAELSSRARVGCRVLVPFSGRLLTGVIVEAPDGASPDTRELAELRDVIDREPVLSNSMLSILLAAAAEILCPPGLAMSAALPPGSAPRVVKQLELTPRGRAALQIGVLSELGTAVLARLERGAATPQRLEHELPGAGREIPALEGDGLVARASGLRKPHARVATERIAEVSDGLDVETVCEQELARAPRQAELLRRIASDGPTAVRALAAGAHVVRALEQRGFIRVARRPAPRDVFDEPCAPEPEVTLTPEQESVLEPICGAIRDERSETFLLHGVTGSGKTEVYLRAVAAALAAGRQALVLVPEITLTHQIVARLRARFGDQLAVLHSGLRPGERLEQWERLQRGDTPIAVGARSALFAPLERLGVIAVDEEHDSAYKNDEGFRYHARDLARLRGQAAGCPVLLGSATPALETRHAADSGEIRRLSLPRRIGGRPLPTVEIVDLARERERSPRGRKLILTRPLRRALEETLAAKNQTILFLNRRGFSTQIFCFGCGFAERCKDCDVALVYHAGEGRLRCHYCDYAKLPPEVCGGCGDPDTALLGVGTERVEEEVRTLFPGARIARLDRDLSRKRGHTASVLRALRRREVDVLVGTQMVAKGHDFPGVALIGVIAADLGLHMPDFRAAERTFQLLTQVAGRAGRAATPGRVIVQSFVPEHYAIAPVRQHDYELFYAEELAQRAALGYPPFGRLGRVGISATDEAQARAAADQIGRRLRDPEDSASPDEIEVLGPAPAPLARLRGRYRFQILIKARDAETLRRTARRAIDEGSRLATGVQAVVDVNPGSML